MQTSFPRFLLFYLLYSEILDKIQSSLNTRCIEHFLNENEIHQSRDLPNCAGPVENLWKGRFQSGLPDDVGSPVEIPAWLNVTLVTLGQRFAANHWFNTNFGMIIAELVVVTAHDRAKTIYYSGGVESWRSAVKRFTANILQHSVWYKEDMFGSKQNILESLTKVRSMHAIVAHRLQSRPKVLPPNSYKVDEPIWRAFEKDLKESSIPRKNREIPREGKDHTEFDINQFAMATTLWGLSAMPIIRAHEFGFPPDAGTDEELEGFLHFWAFIGYSLGIKDEFNVCLQPNIKTARVYFERVLQELLVPYMFDLIYEAKVLIENSLKGFTQAIGPIAQFDFVLKGMLEDVIKIQSANLISKMSPYGRTLDGIWRRMLLPGVRRRPAVQGITDVVYKGYIQNLSKKVFGFDGTNKTIVAENGFSF